MSLRANSDNDEKSPNDEKADVELAASEPSKKVETNTDEGDTVDAENSTDKINAKPSDGNFTEARNDGDEDEKNEDAIDNKYNDEENDKVDNDDTDEFFFEKIEAETCDPGDEAGRLEKSCTVTS